MTNVDARLTASELGNLWDQYINDSLTIQVLKYFVKHVDNEQYRALMDVAVQDAIKHIAVITNIYNAESHPIPKGFTDKDVHPSAPRLFTDDFYMYYMFNMCRYALVSTAHSLSQMSRPDLRQFYAKCLSEAQDLFNQVTNVMQSNGLFTQAPFITPPEKVKFVDRQQFMRGWFGKRRPLHATEINHLFANIQSNIVGKGIVTGFSQVATDRQLRKFMVRGRDISTKHIEVLRSVLMDDHLSVSSPADSFVTNSTLPPFSNKLMMYHTTAVIGIGMIHYGHAIAASQRRDVAVHFSRLLAESALYAEDGANVMIENGWMEKPPIAEDRDALARI